MSVRRCCLLLALPMLLPACASTSEIPPWFDGISRQPVRTATVGGHRVAYLDAGDGPPVILIHGFGGSMWQWEYQQAALAAHHRVLTPDLPGSGLSDKPDLAYTPDEMVAFITGFMDALGIGKAALVGNSMGAGIAMAVAIARPDRVDRLVLIGGLPKNVRGKLASPKFKRAVDTSLPVWLIRLGNWLAGRWATEDVLKEIVHDHSRLTPAVIERSHRNRRRPGFIPPLMATVRNLPLWEQGYALRIGEIACPTLVIWGREDKVFPHEVGGELSGAITGAAFELIPAAGHIPQWEQPEAVNPLLIAFLKP